MASGAPELSGKSVKCNRLGLDRRLRKRYVLPSRPSAGAMKGLTPSSKVGDIGVNSKAYTHNPTIVVKGRDFFLITFAVSVFGY